MEFIIHEAILLRTPSLPFVLNLEYHELIRILNSPSFQESIFLASPVLYQQICSSKDKNYEKLLIPLVKYYLRSSFRCTPFGIFAGCSTVNWGRSNCVLFNKKRRRTQLDSHYLVSLSKKLIAIPEIRKTIKFFPNNSLYKNSDSYRYLESYTKDGNRQYTLSSVFASDELQKIIKKASSGSTFSELTQALISVNYSLEEIESFINELIENQILISDLELKITGENSLKQILRNLSKSDYNPINQVKNALEIIDGHLKLIDKKTNNNISLYQDIIKHIKLIGRPYEENKLFHVNLYTDTQSKSISETIKNSLYKGIEVLRHFSLNLKHPDLIDFKSRFKERYGEKEVPLLEVLDADIGIGYSVIDDWDYSPITDGIIGKEEQVKEYKIDQLQSWLLDKLQHANLFNQYTVEITNEDLKEFPDRAIELPPSFSVVFRVTDFAINEIYIEGISQSSAVNLLSRFAHDDQKINDICKDIIMQEHLLNPEAVFAEIIHLSENRDANVIMHPAFRQYEIPVFASSSLPYDQQIQLHDLYISVKNDRIILKSQRLQKQIILRLSNAHNYRISNLPLYKFLCDLQYQNQPYHISFNWGRLDDHFSFLPRLKYKNIILHLATWQLQKKEWRHLLLLQDKELELALIDFQKKWRMPQWVNLIENDHELLLDFKNSLTIKVLLQTIKNKDKIILKEFLFDPETPIRDIEGGKYMNEFIASCINQQPIFKNEYQKIIHYKEIERDFPPGTEWLYIKYNCGFKAADLILKNAIEPFIKLLLKENLIDKWFFIRYADPHSHIRLRLHLEDIKSINEVIKLNLQFVKHLVESNLIWKVQFDTYCREIERYTIDSIEDSEAIFYHDSECVLNYIIETENTFRSENSWLWAIKGIDVFLDDFKYSLPEKHNIMKELKDDFFKEFKVEKITKLTIDNNYRKFKAEMRDFLSKGNRSSNHEVPIHLFTKRSKRIKSNIQNILAIHKDSATIKELLKSYIHMFLNRLLTNNHRYQEMIIYDFLCRYYTSQMAKKG